MLAWQAEATVIYTVLTLFPQLLEPWTQEALLGRARAQGLLDIRLQDLRAFAGNKHNNVDDTPYGGGAGMVIRVDVVVRALESLATAPPDEVILLTPAGEPLKQPLVQELASRQHLALLCGRYEGFDARVEHYVTREVSIGDYVMMGGEVAALALIEATARLLPGVLGDPESHLQDSFSSASTAGQPLLDYPEYTRPAVFRGEAVPEVLLSGHHGNIAAWRAQQMHARTRARRPDLLATTQTPSDNAEGEEADR